MLLRYINKNFTGETVFLFKLIFNAIGDRIFFLFPNDNTKSSEKVGSGSNEVIYFEVLHLKRK